MSLRWNGSVLGRQNLPTNDLANGAWSLRSQSLWRSNIATWPRQFVPITTNRILHIDPSRASTVTLNGGTVSAITDLSSSPKTVNQTTAARQPLYTINARNGLNALFFTAANTNFLNTDSITIPASHTVFMVFNRATSAIVSMGIGAASVATRYSFAWLSDNVQYSQTNTSFSQLQGANTSTGWFYVTMRRNGTTQLRYRRNGTTIADITTGTHITSAASGSWNAIGQDFASRFHQGFMGELIVYDTNLSDSDVDSVESYLATKWGF